jgi:L-seryl-tRNA(Ser) seleniumtransferase
MPSKEAEETSARTSYRSIPQVEKLLEHPVIAARCAALSRPLVARIVSDVLAAARNEIRERGTVFEETALVRRIEQECERLASKRIRKVINATGIILHTNMGRSPISRAVWDKAADANTGYSNVELDLATGRRGSRNGICPELLGLLTGCEDALVVNNNAAAVLLTLTSLARGRDVIVSRGEQVQIGGGFRIPEILALSGARLIEVGTTNITTLADYVEAVTENTAMVLLVHTSNFRIRGFTEKPDIAALAKSLPPGVVLAVDQGSGTTSENIAGETRVRSLLEKGAHLVCFSGDKVLGGPQAGIVAGKGELVRRLAAHPLLRVVRPGKTIYSLLEQHLVARISGAEIGHAERILALTPEELLTMGKKILDNIPDGAASLVSSRISTGGGSAPDEYFPSLSIELASKQKPEDLLRSLRNLETPIIGVIEDGRVRLSLATMHGEDDHDIAAAIRTVLGD